MADETEKTGKKCDPGNNQKTENAVCRNPDRSDRSSCGSGVFCDPSLFCPARTYRNIGSCEGRTPDGVWSENHTCTKKQPDG